MKKSRFTESQILAILVEGGSGLPVAEVCRKHGISNATYYQWKSKYAGMSLPELKRVKELEAENARLKRMYAELALENTAIKDVLLAPSAKRSAVEVMCRSIDCQRPRPAGLQACRGRRYIESRPIESSGMRRWSARLMKRLRDMVAGASGNASSGCVTKGMSGITREYTGCIAA